MAYWLSISQLRWHHSSIAIHQLRVASKRQLALISGSWLNVARLSNSQRLKAAPAGVARNQRNNNEKIWYRNINNESVSIINENINGNNRSVASANKWLMKILKIHQ
jgi:lipocalin